MCLGDIFLNTVCIILEDAPAKTVIMKFWEEIHLGHVLKMVNSILTGHFNDMAVLKFEGMTLSSPKFAINKNMLANINADE